MKVLLTTGCQHSGYERVFDLLCQAGVAPAQPGRELGHGPQALQALLLDSHDVKASQEVQLRQLRPGRLWHEPVADLLLANVQAPLWGWADHRTALLMDFWQDYDPQVRLLLVYNDPAHYLTNRYRHERAPAGLADGLAQWKEWNAALLRHHLQHPQRSLLVNAEAALRDPGALLGLLRREWKLEGLRDVPKPADADDLAAVLVQSAQGLAASDQAACDLEQELQSAAQLPALSVEQRAFDAMKLWSAACDLAQACEAQVAQARSRHAELAHQAEAQKAELAQAQQALAQRGVAHEEAAAQAQQLAQRCEALQAQLAEQAQRAEQAQAAARGDMAALEEENELLRLQLLQLQEELQLYFQKCQQLQQEQQARANGFMADFWRTHQPDTLTLDLRRPVFGEQWYDAEADGRWSGPASVSTLTLPPLRAGLYLLEMDVMDAMDPEMVLQTQVELPDGAYPLNVEFLGGELAFPAICSAQFVLNHDTTEPLQLHLRLPRTISPAELGVNDGRHLGIRVQQVRLMRQASEA